MNNRVAYLISKKLSGEISESETHELNACLMADPSLFEIISLLEIAWRNSAEEPDQNSIDVYKLMQRLRQEEPGKMETSRNLFVPENEPVVSVTKPHRKYGWLMVAATLALVLLATWRFWPATGEVPEENIANIENKVVTRPGNRTQIELRDGTKVWLNGDSKLTYHQVGVGELREVYLSGEAYFEVVSNPARPFIIHTEKTTVKVTGTTLNVRDYPGEEKAETSLLTGKAEVVAKTDPSKIFFLKPNQKVVFSRYEEKMMQKDPKKTGVAEVLVSYQPKILKLNYYPNDTIPVATAWVSDQLVFSDESFRDVADKMEKWYNVTIEIRSARLGEARLSGKFETETLPVALQALQFTTPFQYIINGNKVIIDKK